MLKKYLLVLLLFTWAFDRLYSLDRQPYYINAETYSSYKELLRGVHYFNQERYDAAIESFKTSLNSNPTDKFVRYWYSRALYKAGYMPLAVNEWRNLERMGYGDPTIMSKLDKYSTAPVSDIMEEKTFSNFIYLRQFSTNPNFLKNINQPIDLQVSSDGRLYVLDYSDSALKIFDANGVLLQTIKRGKRIETPQTGFRRILQILFKIYPYEKMSNPRAFKVDEAGNIYIANTGKNEIFKFDAYGNHINSIGGSGISDGQFLSPSSLDIDADGKLYVADTGNNRISIFDADGVYITSFGSIGDGNGQFFRPSGIAINKNNIFVADTGNKRVEMFDIYGNYIETISHETFNEPRGLSFSLDGNLFIADGSSVYYYSLENKNFTLFQNSKQYTTTPTAISEGTDGSLYLADFLSGRIDVYTRKEQYYANLDVFIDRIYLSEFPSVVQSVTVRDRFGVGIDGLTAQNFYSVENAMVNRQVDLYQTEEMDQYRFIYLIEDSSESAKYREQILAEVKAFTDVLEGNDEVMVIHYNNQIRPPTLYDARNLRIIENASQFTFDGNNLSLASAMHEAIRLAGASFKKTSVIHFTVSDVTDINFEIMQFNELAAFAKNNAVSVSHVYLGRQKSNYFLDNISRDTLGKALDGDASIDYGSEISDIKNLKFGRYFIRYASQRALTQIGDYRSVLVRVQYRDMYGEEEAGYIVP